MQNFELGDHTFELGQYFKFILNCLVLLLCSYLLDLRYEISSFLPQRLKDMEKSAVSHVALSQSTYNLQ